MNDFKNEIERELENTTFDNDEIREHLIQFTFGENGKLTAELLNPDNDSDRTPKVIKQGDTKGKISYFGSCVVSRMENVVDGDFSKKLETTGCEFHSDHGIYIQLESISSYWPSKIEPSVKPALHLFSDGKDWYQRLVRSLPSVSDIKKHFSVDGLLDAYKTELQDKINLGAFSEYSERYIGGLPQWCDSTIVWPGSTGKSLTPFEIQLIGVNLDIDYEDGPLRFRPSLIKAMRLSKNKYAVELWEGFEQNSKPIHWLELGENGVSANERWNLAFHVLPPLEAESLAPGAQDSKKSMWVHSNENDEWLRIGLKKIAEDTLKGETRRWLIGNLPDRSPDSANLLLWLDNCGPKCLRAELNSEGKFEELTLGIERPKVELRINSEVFVSDDPTSDTITAAPPGNISTPPSTRGVVLMSHGESPSQDEFAFSVELKTDGSFSIGSQNLEMVHWIRTSSALVAPVEWSRNDPNSSGGISSLRGLIPLKPKSGIAVSFEKGNSSSITVHSDNGYRFPDFAIGKVLLLASDDPHRVKTEIQIVGASEVKILERHALPHLDSFYAKSVLHSDESGRDVVHNDESLTWVKDRYASVETHSNDIKDAIPYIYDLSMEKATVNETIENTPELPMGPQRSPESALIGAVWYPGWCRWSAFSEEPLTATLGDKFEIIPLGLRFDDAKDLEGIDFSISPKGSEGQPTRNSRLTYYPKSEKIKGSLFFDKESLSQTYSEKDVEIDWQERKPENGPSVSFLGVESENFSILSTEDSPKKISLILDGLRYWFVSEGLQFCIQTTDKLSLHAGRWIITNDMEAGPSMQIEGAVGERTKIEVTFEHTSLIVPHVKVVETLLGGPHEKLLVLHYTDTKNTDHKIEFDVDTSYLSSSESAPAVLDTAETRPRKALMRAGNYHLGWAGNVGSGNPVSDIIDGLELGALTRLFLTLQRDGDGTLKASGMIGWKCASISVGGDNFTSEKATASVYASKSGVWTKLRLSGKWVRNPGSVAKATAVVLQRADLRLSVPNEHPLRISPQMLPTMLVGYVRKIGDNPTFCFQSLTFSNETPSPNLVGDVRLQRYEKKPNEMTGQTQRFSTISVDWSDPHLLRNRLKLSDGTPWWAIDIPEFEKSITDWIDIRSGWKFKGTGKAVQHVVGPLPLAGLTRRSENDKWLLCPVNSVDEPAFTDRTPKLWLIHEDGEDLIQLDGFKERLGDELDKNNIEEDTGIKGLRKIAEQVLSYIRWRTPAVLEYWNGDNPTWSVVDAPLLNPFSSLAYMDGGAVSGVVSTQRDPGFIVSETLPSQASELKNGEYRDSAVLVTRETPFEKGPKVEKFVANDPWLADSAGWPAFREVDSIGVAGTINPGPWTNLLPQLTWEMASPRPGELVSFMAESAWQGKAADDLTRIVVSDVFFDTCRTHSESGVRKIDCDIEKNAVIWKVADPIPAVAPPIMDSGLSLHVGSPDSDRLEINKPFSLAVANSDHDDGKGLVLRFSLSKEFRFSIKGVDGVNSEKVDGEESHCAYVTFPSGSQDRPFACLIETSNEPDHETGKLEVAITDGIAGVLPGFTRPTTQPESWTPKAKIESAISRLQSGRPMIVGILGKDGRLLAYGPSDIWYRIETASANLVWQAYGEWRASNINQASNAKSVVLIGLD